MIIYKSLFQLEGSVFPQGVVKALPIAILTAAWSVFLHGENDQLPDTWIGSGGKIFQDSTAWTSFSTFLAFLVVFRTSQAYSRFWEGCTAITRMRAEWLEGANSLVSFCRYSDEPEDKVHEFQGLLVRLFSMLHALAYAEIEDKTETAEVAAYSYELIDPASLDEIYLQHLTQATHRVDLVFQWIQNLSVDAMKTGVLSIPAPVLSRAFQELATGMVHFADAMKISMVPFPFPYAQTCDVLLIFHALMTPFVMGPWIDRPWWAFNLSFIQVFIFVCLNQTARELENPFGRDANDIDAGCIQQEVNAQLLQLLHPGALDVPKLSESASMGIGRNLSAGSAKRQSFFGLASQSVHNDNRDSRDSRFTTRRSSDDRSVIPGLSTTTMSFNDLDSVNDEAAETADRNLQTCGLPLHCRRGSRGETAHAGEYLKCMSIDWATEVGFQIGTGEDGENAGAQCEEGVDRAATYTSQGQGVGALSSGQSSGSSASGQGAAARLRIAKMNMSADNLEFEPVRQDQQRDEEDSGGRVVQKGSSERVSLHRRASGILPRNAKEGRGRGLFRGQHSNSNSHSKTPPSSDQGQDLAAASVAVPPADEVLVDGLEASC